MAGESPAEWEGEAPAEPDLVAKLDAFVAKCKHYGITNISEGEGLDAFHARVKKQLQGS